MLYEMKQGVREEERKEGGGGRGKGKEKGGKQ